MDKYRYQGGSLGGYIVVAILLALALIGGLYGLGRWNESRQVAENNQSEERQPAEENGSTGNSAAQDETKKREEAAKKEREAAAQREAAARAQQNATTSSPSSSNLPVTGPTDDLARAVAILAVTYAGVSYLVSRRAVRL